MHFGFHVATHGHSFLRVIVSLIILALLVAAVVWIVSSFTRGRQPPPGPPAPEGAREILDRRLASGELTVAQYQQLRKAIADEPATVRRRATPPAAGTT
jgi:uncharacterized membrane protein